MFKEWGKAYRGSSGRMSGFQVESLQLRDQETRQRLRISAICEPVILINKPASFFVPLNCSTDSKNDSTQTRPTKGFDKISIPT